MCSDSEDDDDEDEDEDDGVCLLRGDLGISTGDALLLLLRRRRVNSIVTDPGDASPRTRRPPAVGMSLLCWGEWWEWVEKRGGVRGSMVMM